MTTVTLGGETPKRLREEVLVKLGCETPKRSREEVLKKKTQNDPILYDKRDPPTYVTAPGRRIVAIGDVHGDVASTESALQLAGVLSSDGLGRWVGGSTILVQLGDILDRGEDEIAILSLLHNLSEQAQCTGGAVFQINGNHETMNVKGHFRNVTPGGYEEAAHFKKYCEEVWENDYEAAFSGWYLASKKRKASKNLHSTVMSTHIPSPRLIPPAAMKRRAPIPSRRNPPLLTKSLPPLGMKRKDPTREFLFRPGGPIARKLSQHGVVLKVNDWLFAHGGVLPLHVKYGLEKLNDEVAQWMRGDNKKSQKAPVMAIEGSDSIVWSRLYSEGEFKASAVLEATLEAVGAKALVVGHTIQITGANSECQGKIWRLDVGMSSGVRNAQPEVLEIVGNHARVLKAKKKKKK